MGIERVNKRLQARSGIGHPSADSGPRQNPSAARPALRPPGPPAPRPGAAPLFPPRAESAGRMCPASPRPGRYTPVGRRTRCAGDGRTPAAPAGQGRGRRPVPDTPASRARPRRRRTSRPRTPPPKRPPPTAPRRRTTAAALCAVVLALSGPGPTAGLPVLVAHLDVSRSAVPTAHLVGTLSGAPALPWLGRAADRVGAPRTDPGRPGLQRLPDPAGRLPGAGAD